MSKLRRNMGANTPSVIETKSLKALRGTIEAYRTTMQSIRYQLLFNNLKKK